MFTRKKTYFFRRQDLTQPFHSPEDSVGQLLGNGELLSKPGKILTALVEFTSASPRLENHYQVFVIVKKFGPFPYKVTYHEVN